MDNTIATCTDAITRTTIFSSSIVLLCRYQLSILPSPLKALYTVDDAHIYRLSLHNSHDHSSLAILCRCVNIYTKIILLYTRQKRYERVNIVIRSVKHECKIIKLQSSKSSNYLLNCIKNSKEIL